MHVAWVVFRVRIVGGVGGLGLNPPSYIITPPVNVPGSTPGLSGIMEINVFDSVLYRLQFTFTHYTNSSFISCMKASTLIGLPLVLLLGSFGPTWHLVGTSNIYCKLAIRWWSFMLNWLFFLPRPHPYWGGDIPPQTLPPRRLAQYLPTPLQLFFHNSDTGCVIV